MIDKVHMNTVIDIPLDSFNISYWKKFHSRGNTLYYHKCNGVKFYYSIRSSRLTILGRLYNLSDNRNKIGNLDLLYEGMAGIQILQEQQDNGTVIYSAESYTQDLDDLINTTNDYINNLLNINIDIRKFKVTHIEFCFNLYTPYVGEYCKIFNKVFTEKPHKSYTSHVRRQGLSEETSFYIRSNAQYKKNEGARNTINFYDKLNQLGYLIDESSWDFGTEKFGDITGAINILRLEVQVGHLALNQLYDQKGLERLFHKFLDPMVARDIIVHQYERIIGNSSIDFYSYNEACGLVNASGYTVANKRRICNFLLNYMRHQNKPCKNTRDKYWKLLKNIGIHWCMIPSSYNIPHLESPITLLDLHIGHIEENRDNIVKRFLGTVLEADMFNSITDEDDEIIYVPDDSLDE